MDWSEFAGFISIMALVGVCILTLRMIRKRPDEEIRDPGEALVEFGEAFPDEAIRSIMMDKSGQTTFMRLANGKTGLVQTVANQFVVRVIEPGEVALDLAEDDAGTGLILTFDDDSLIGGRYTFSTPEDAAEITLWMCGSFGLKMAESAQD